MEDPPVRSASSVSHSARIFPFQLSPSPSREPECEYKDDEPSLSYKINRYARESIWPGLGLFGESYILFSIGTLKPIWEMLYPHCLRESNADNQNDDNRNDDNHEYYCDKALVHSLSYSVVLGVITGMVLLGFAANTIGRRKGSILTASFMCVGSFGMAFLSIFNSSNEEDAQKLFTSMTVLLFIFGIGVGGEYPLSASTASERAMRVWKEKEKEALEWFKYERRLNTRDHTYFVDDATVDTLPSNKSFETVHTTPSGITLPIANTYLKKSAVRPSRPISPPPPPPPPPPTTPLTNTTISAANDNHDCHEDLASSRRGKRVLLVFAMQGMGIFFHSLSLTFLLMITGQFGGKSYGRLGQNQQYYGNVNYDAHDGDIGVMGYYDQITLLMIWRIIYVIGASILSYVLISRILHLQESSVWAEDKERREENERLRKEQQEKRGKFVPPTVRDANGSGNDTDMSFDSYAISYCSDGDDGSHCNDHNRNNTETDYKHLSKMQLLLKHYGHRLFGTSMTWLLWDVAFYGNKLFQSSFLLALTGEQTTLFEISAASTLNALIALLGYFAAASVVDNPRIGRLKLQQYGFLITGSLFCLCGFLRENLSSTALITMYFGSSFFGQCGPNCTTFLIPAEIFPTEMRTACHGLSASAGKLGALLAAVLFNYASEADMFLISGYCSFVACVITFVTIPESTTLDLFELDKKWRMTLNGRAAEYEGAASDLEHLSFWERGGSCLHSHS